MRAGPRAAGSGQRQARGRAGRSRSRRRDDRGDQRAGHGCPPRREAGPVSAVGRPQASARASACSSGALKRVMYHHSGCPRGDLNPHGRAFSPILRLNTQVGEKSPSWGFHAASIAGAPRPASTRFRWPIGRNGSGCVEVDGGAAPGRGAGVPVLGRWLSSGAACSRWVIDRPSSAGSVTPGRERDRARQRGLSRAGRRRFR